MPTKDPMPGPGQFQWNTGGWFGGQLGGTLWILVGAATLILMLATEPRLAIVWDESYTLGREARLRSWFRALRDPAGFAATWSPPAIELVQQQGAFPVSPDRRDTRGELLFDPAVLAWFWPFAREEPHGCGRRQRQRRHRA